MAGSLLPVSELCGRPRTSLDESMGATLNGSMEATVNGSMEATVNVPGEAIGRFHNPGSGCTLRVCSGESLSVRNCQEQILPDS